MDYFFRFFLRYFTTAALAFSLLIVSCSDDDESFDCTSSDLQAAVSNVLDASCSLDNGSFELTISGDAAPFELTVPGLGTQTVQAGTSTVENVPAGNYNISIRDNNNCNTSLSVVLDDVNNVAVEAQIEASGCQTANGTITVIATGGKEPYLYSLDGGAMQADNVFSGLEVGDYTALVTDDDGCQNSTTVSVLSGVSYNNNIVPLFETNCSLSGCHDGSNAALPNWTDFATVQANAENIKTRTLDGTMPPAGRPDLLPAEIQAIACWVDDGALNN